MVAIRSWSGGRVLDDISLESFASIDTQDEEITSNNSEKDLSASITLSWSDNYDDDFIDDETQNLEGYNEKLNENKALLKCDKDENDMNSFFLKEQVCNQISIAADSREDTVKSDKNIYSANVQCKKWLIGIQQSKKLKAECENKLRCHLKEREKLKRDRLVRRALMRRKIRFDDATNSSQRSQIEGKGGEEKSKSMAQGGRKSVDHVQKQRNISQHKNLLVEIVKRREKESAMKLQHQQEADRKRRNVTRMVLQEIKNSKSDIPGHLKDHSNSAQCRKEITTIETSAESLKQRCIEEFKKIAENRQKQNDEMRKLELRLEKRAKILRQHYIRNLQKDKVWERPTNFNNKEKHDRGPEDKEKSTGIVLTPSKIRALSERLSKNTEAKSCFFNKSENFDMNRWKIKHHVEEGQKVFSMTGWYPSIREDLIHRGWFYNKDRDSPYFDLKFTLAASDIDFNTLRTNQLVNHFRTSTCLTTKVGLVRTLKNSVHCAMYNKDANDFFPRSYDLSYCTDVEAFFDDFHCIQAESVLRRLLTRWDSNESFEVNFLVVKTLNVVIRKCHLTVDDQFIDSDGSFHDQCFTSLQSKIILNAHRWIYRKVDESELLDDESSPTTRIKNILMDKMQNVHKEKCKPNQRRKFISSLSRLEKISGKQIRFTEDTLAKYCKFSLLQKDINGVQSNNVWILKPAGKSRGRGISVESSLTGILDHIESESDSRNKMNQWVVQKYIENPLIVSKRKFDIRQWILVTNWNPITIWYYDDCYIRFAVDKYDDPGQIVDQQLKKEWSSNRFRHLVNNSIGKQNENFTCGFLVEETNETVNGYMWSLSSFKKWLKQKTGRQEWEESISPSIIKIVIDSLLCSQENMLTMDNNGCWELYGFDIMIDQNLRPWLIEVNSSPACDYSTTVTETFVRKALPDTLKVVLETTNHEDLKGLERGGWRCIYHGISIPKVVHGLGLDLPLKGKKIVRTINQRKGKAPRRQRDTTRIEKDASFNDSDLSDFEQKSENTTTSTKTKSHEDNKENEQSSINSREIVKKRSKTLKCYNIQTKKKNYNNMVAVHLNKITIGI